MRRNELDLEERVYLARFYVSDGARKMEHVLGKPWKNLAQTVETMKKSGDWDLYRGLSHEQYEKIIIAKERRLWKNERRT